MRAGIWQLGPGSSHYPQFSQLSVTLSRPLIATAPQRCSAVTSSTHVEGNTTQQHPTAPNSSSGQCRQARTCWCSGATPDWARHQHQHQHAAATVLSINNLTCADIRLQEPGTGWMGTLTHGRRKFLQIFVLVK